MKKLLIAVVLMLSSSAFANKIELNERDSRDLYEALAKWGVRDFDKKHDVIRIDVEDVKCWFGRSHDNRNDNDSDVFCKLYDDNHNKELKRGDKAAWWLVKLLVDHVGKDCNGSSGVVENGKCFTGADEIHCRHDWDPKPRNGDHHRRDYWCWIDPIRRGPESN